MGKPRILIVEDERQLATTLEYNLRREGYEPTLAFDGEEGLRKAQSVLPDLILLDVMLPGMNGLEVCKKLRAGEHTADVPVIMLTARTEESDQIEGLAVGADDYVTKPFSTKVLVQRIKAHLRRREGRPEESDRIERDGVCVDRLRYRVTSHGAPIELTPTEYRLLECLIKQAGRAFSRHELMDAAILEGSIVLERTIDVHVKTLRKKLGDRGHLIETVRGVGYRFAESDLNPEMSDGES